MATIFQNPIRRINPETGKMENAFDAKGKPLFHPKWRAVIVTHKGLRKTFTFGTNKPLAQKQADMLETREREIRNGLRPVPAASDVNASRPFVEVAAEYVAWGKAQGGKRGMPWIPTHVMTKTRHLTEWRELLGLEKLADLYGILPKVEAVCRKWLDGGKSGKTVSVRVESLRSFIIWSKKRKYLTENPIEEIGKFDTTPVNIRRAMTHLEIKLLLEGCAPHRRLLYEVAICTGLRENELRQLTPRHLDREACAIIIDKKWDKGRKDRLQYISQELMNRLIEFVDSGKVESLYEKAIEQQGKRDKLKSVPENALLYVPRNSADRLKADLTAAGIPIKTEAGKLDFHALRTAYINLVIETGADLKTAQTLARHATPELTMNVYGRARDSSCRQAAEAVGRMVFSDDLRQGETNTGHENYTKLTQVQEKYPHKKPEPVLLERVPVIELERAKRFEPSTPTLARWCSSH